MSQIREIKDRMNGIQSTMKITKAMYMISSTKMNTAKQKAANTDPYFYSLRKQILTILQNLPDHFEHPYLDSREYIDEKHMEKTLKRAKTPEIWLAKMQKIVQKTGKNNNMDNYTAIAVFLD